MEDVNKKYREGLEKKLNELKETKEMGKKYAIDKINEDCLSDARDLLNDIMALETVIDLFEEMKEGG